MPSMSERDTRVEADASFSEMGEDESHDQVREPDILLGISKPGWFALIIGFIAALLVSWAPLLKYLFSFFATLVHEMGHAFAGWLFGYPSIPSFDFYYGGGVTLQENRIILLNVLVFLLLAVLGYLFRKDTFLLMVVVFSAAMYALLTFSKWHEPLIIALGHGTELIIAGIFLFRAMSGKAIIQKTERPVYAFTGFFLVMYNVSFTYQLITDSTFRWEYEYSKGEMTMDFSRLAYEYLHTDLATVAKIFLMLALLTPFASLGCNLVYRLRSGPQG